MALYLMLQVMCHKVYFHQKPVTIYGEMQLILGIVNLVQVEAVVGNVVQQQLIAHLQVSALIAWVLLDFQQVLAELRDLNQLEEEFPNQEELVFLVRREKLLKSLKLRLDLQLDSKQNLFIYIYFFIIGIYIYLVKYICYIFSFFNFKKKKKKDIYIKKKQIKKSVKKKILLKSDN